MDMASLISDMAVEPQASPSSPEARASSALEAAPDVAVARRTQVRKAKRCLAEAFGEDKKLWPRAPSPDEDPPLLLLSPRREALADVDMVQDQGQGAGGKGVEQGKGAAGAAEARPSKTLRLQERSKQAADGSKENKAVPLQRTLSVYKPFPSREELDAETLFAQSELAQLRSPARAEPEAMFDVGEVAKRSPVKVSPAKSCGAQERSLSPLARCLQFGVKFGELDAIDLNQFEMEGGSV
jgi:hypothetical protein